MSWVDWILYRVATIELVCLVMLAIGIGLTFLWSRPIERLRTIQATLVAMTLACLLQSLHVWPQRSLGWLEFESAAQPAASELTAVLAADVNGSPAERTAGNASPLVMAGPPPRTTDAVALAAPAAAIDEAVTAAAPRATTTTVAAPSAAESATARVGRYLRAVLLAVFAAGAAGSLLHLLPGVVRLRGIERRSQPAPPHVVRLLTAMQGSGAGGTTVRTSSEIAVPLAYGVFRGVIMLPEALAQGADAARVQYCLAHEWSHIRRRDTAQWWGVQLCQALLWCQPLYWLLRREMRVCQDQIADQFAARQARDPLAYAQLLVDLARQSRRAELAMALTMSGPRSSLERRIRLLTERGARWASICRRRALVAPAVVLAIGAGGVALVDLAAAQAEATAAQTSSVERDVTETIQLAPEPAPRDTVQPSQPPAPRTPAPGDPAPPAKTLKYFGVIADKSTQEPIAGAQVTVRRSISAKGRERIVEETRHTTDDKGLYRFTIPPEQSADPALYIELDVEHPNYAPKSGFGYSLAMIRKNLRKGEPPFFTRTVLDPAEAVSGRLVDGAGKPVPGVALQAYSVGPPARPGAFEYGSFVRATSADDGTFRMNLVRGGTGMLWIAPDRLAPRQMLLGNKKGDLGDVLLSDGVAVTGQVVDAEGRPLAGVWVNVVDEAAQKEIDIPVATSLRRSAQTDEQGQFRLDPLKPGVYTLNVEGSPFDLRLSAKRRPKVPVPAVFLRQTITVGEPPQPLRVQAVPHVQFVGRYRDAKGNDCRGSEVTVFGSMNGQNYFAQIEPDARGHIDGRLPLGLERAQVQLLANEHSALRIRLGKDQPLLRYHHTPFPLGTIDHDVADVEIIRYVAPIVTLKVVDADGQRVRDAQVGAVYVDADSPTFAPIGNLPSHIGFEKQIDGSRRTSQMLPDEKTKFIARAAGFQDAEQVLSLPEGAEQELVLTLKRAADAPPAPGDRAGNAGTTNGPTGTFRPNP